MHSALVFIPVATVLILLQAFAGCSGLPAPTPQEEGDPVTRILRQYTVVDTAVTTRFFRFPEEPKTAFDPAALVEAGMDVAALGIGTITEELIIGDFSPYLYKSPPPGKVMARSVFTGPAAVKRFLWEVDAVHEAVLRNPQRVGLARTAGDVQRLRSEGKLALLMGVDAGNVVEDLATLRTYHRLGLRRLELAHASAAAWADSCSSILDDDDPGLEPFGAEVIRECNRLGILVDLSHASDETMRETLEASQKPVIASHSGARAVVDAVRNLSDDLLRALADNGGMIGVGAYYDPKHLEPIRATGAWAATSRIHNYLAEQYSDPFRLAAAIRNPAELTQARKTLGLPPRSRLQGVKPHSGVITEGSSVEGTLDHIDHIVNLIGIEHVGIGTDIDMRREDYIWIYRQLVAGLLERGYTPKQVGMILGGNFLRVLRANEN